MQRLIHLLIAFVFLAALVPAQAVHAQPPIPEGCTFRVDSTTGEQVLVCQPLRWNGDLVVFAHGYVPDVPPNSPPIFPWEQLTVPNSTTTLPGILTGLGYLFAATSYTQNGLVVVQGIQDIRNLVTSLRALYPIRRVFLVGASEGGLITTLAVEQYPAEFSGGVSVCGPVGDFRAQIQYFGDFRVLFDHYFPVLPALYGGTPVDIPPALMADWVASPSPAKLAVLGALSGAPVQSVQDLLKAARAPIDPADPVNTTAATTLGLLDYSVLAMMNAQQVLQAQPYDNTATWYSGTSNDALLNATVARYPGAGDIAGALAPYQTSGRLKKPLVTMHTTLDPIVPIWQQTLYRLKVYSAGSFWKYNGLVVNRYGHCNFKAPELLFGFGLMLVKSTFRPVTAEMARQILGSDQEVQDFLQLNREYEDITLPPPQIYLPSIQR